MSVAGLLTDQVGAGRGQSIGPSTGLGETVPSAFDFTWKAHTTAAAIQYQGLPLNQRNDLIKQRFGQDIYDITKLREKYPNPTSEGRLQMIKEANDQIDGWIERGRTEAPDKYEGIKTSREIREDARKTVDISESHMNEIMARNPSTLSRITGGFVGSVGAALLDPPNLLTLPFGAGEVKAGLKGWAAARATIKAAAIDGSINAAVEASSQPAIMAWQKELGRRYGFGDAAENVALAFAGGAGLSALIRGGVRGAKAGINYAGSVSADMLDRIASSEKLPASVRDAAAFMSRQAHIDESAPPGMVKTGEDLKVHRQTTQKVADDFEAYQTQTSAQEPDIAAQPEGQAKIDEVAKDLEELQGRLVEQEFGGVVTSMHEKENGILLNTIEVDEELRGQGFGTKAMEEIARYADATGQRVLLTPTTELGGSSVKRLTDFYKRFGFVENKGKKKDAAIKEAMIREPKKVTPEKKAALETRTDPMDDVKPPERMEELDLPEELSPEISADRVAIAESDLKGLTDELGDEEFALEDGTVMTIKDFAKEIQGKKNLIDAMKTCRIA